MGLLDINGPWVTATALDGSFVGPSCVPHLNPTDDCPGAVVAPTHEGTFTSAAPQSSSVDVQLGGVHRLVAADGRFELAISNCKARRRLETCELELRAMTLDLNGPLVFSDYSIDTAVLSLEKVGKASVTFDCSDGLSCAGSRPHPCTDEVLSAAVTEPLPVVRETVVALTQEFQAQKPTPFLSGPRRPRVRPGQHRQHPGRGHHHRG